MKIDFSKYTIEELKRLIVDAENYLYEYDDGHIYICVFRRYGTTSEHAYTNLHIPEKFAEEYNGEDGIMDIYTTNPDLKELPFYNYGDTYYIKSIDDYADWKVAMRAKNTVEMLEKEHEKWASWVERKGDALRDIWTGEYRPTEPTYTKEEVQEKRSKFEALKYIDPVLINSGTEYAYDDDSTTQIQEGDI